MRTLTLMTMAGVALGMIGAPALAGIAQSTLAVTASVGNNCLINAIPAAIGAYDPVGANATSNLAGLGGVVVTCTVGASTTIGLDQGQNAAPGSTTVRPLRQMASGDSRLGYQLYQDSAHSVVWGASAATSETYMGTGAPSTLIVYASVPSGQNVPAGAYADAVVAQINF